jgi:hypothetical protein
MEGTTGHEHMRSVRRGREEKRGAEQSHVHAPREPGIAERAALQELMRIRKRHRLSGVD